MKRYDLII